MSLGTDGMSTTSPTLARGDIPVALPRLAPVLLLVICGYLLFFFRLADRDLWSSHEARAAQDAESILADGRWLLPRLLDRSLELQKPPLYYWLIAVVSHLRNQPVDAWSVRLPAALAGL